MPHELSQYGEAPHPMLPVGFSCSRSMAGRSSRVTVAGELDIATVAQLDRELRGAENDATAVVLDLRGLDFIDCIAARLLLATNRRIVDAGGRLIIVRGSGMVDWFFSLIGIDRLLELVDQPPSHLGEAA